MRRSSIMAPALTEASQAQNLKIPHSPSSETSPGSPVGLPVRTYGSHDFTPLANGHAKLLYNNSNGGTGGGLKIFALNGKSRPSHVATSNGVDVMLERLNGNEPPPAVDAPLHTFRRESELLTANGETSSADRATLPNDVVAHRMKKNDFVVNYDKNVHSTATMGLQRTNSIDTTVSKERPVKDKSVEHSEVDHILSRLSDAIGEPPHNVDDLLNVFEKMGDTTSSDMSSLSHLENQFLQMNDVMSMYGVDHFDSGVSKETLAREKLELLHKRQHDIERKRDRLLRRVQKLHTRGMSKHLHGQLGALVDFGRRHLKEGITSDVTETVNLVTLSDKADDPTSSSLAQLESDVDLFHNESVKHLSTTELVNLVRRMERKQSSGLRSQPSVASKESPRVLVRFNEKTSDEIGRACDRLRGHLSHIECGLDSDATASSSGGESCDEMDVGFNREEGTKPILKRAMWRWCKSRAAVASRWTWLQAQVSDLEYRIRQQEEICRRFQDDKNSVIGADSVNSDRTSVGVAEGESTLTHGDDGRTGREDWEGTASRTRPFVRPPPSRKRKPVRHSGLHLISKKAARPNTVRCGCRPPLEPCVACGGRVHHVVEMDADLMPTSERTAVVDSGFHPVLSFQQDSLLSVHLESLLKSGGWQRNFRRTPLQTKEKKQLVPKRKRGRPGREKKKFKKQKHEEHRRKYTRKLKKNATSTLQAKFKKKLNKRHNSDNNTNTMEMKRQAAQECLAAMKNMEELHVDTSMSGRIDSSPMPSPSFTEGGERKQKNTMLHDLLRRKRDENPYDIDNIVIPFNMVTTTRVERLPYKEILTPKWRLLDESDNLVTASQDEEEEEDDEEDVSEEAILLRHNRCEEMEKKKFQTHAHPGRLRSRRADSRNESGTNTPDPMSPQVFDSFDTYSPLTSPPSTPLSFSLLEEGLQAAALKERRSSRQRTDDTRSNTPDLGEEMFVAPYENRVFPISEEEYQRMLMQNPPLPEPIQHRKVRTNRRTVDSKSDTSSLFSRPSTPSSTSSTDSAMDDPNDPEWTVTDMPQEGKGKPGLVLKLSKR